MGQYWLHAARDPLIKALGAKFKLYSGYETRCRSSGGFDRIAGILMHHDADTSGGSDDSVINYEYQNAASKPIGNFHVQRDGDVWFGAAGASNHAGLGGPVSTSSGGIPLNRGNQHLIGIEASNDGVGEVWNTTMLESYLILVTVLCKTFNLDPLQDIYGHWTWVQPSCPGRKIDPRGPTPAYPKWGGSSGTNMWNMNEVRKEVNARLTTTKPPEPAPSPTPPSTDWAYLGSTYPSPPGQPNLKKGMNHSNNPWLQAVLCSMPKLPADGGGPIFNPAWVCYDTIPPGTSTYGLFGNATYDALTYWQSKNGLKVDGIFGDASSKKMIQVRGK